MTRTLFAYDDSGKPLSVEWQDEAYLYRYDDRGSVIELTGTSTHQAAATYTYDAYGRVLEATGEPDHEMRNGSGDGLGFETERGVAGARRRV